MTSACVIGGTRFFGKILVRDLLRQGHRVTVLTRGRTGDEFGGAVERLRADANRVDELTAALIGRTFDVVIHQMCYSPIAALAACAAFAGRVGRLVMTSTIEVYNPDSFSERPAPPVSPLARECELDAASHGFDAGLPWLEPGFADRRYGEGKRQAESALVQRASFPVVCVRVGHVLAERDEFTGRFAFHVERILRRRPIKSWPRPGRTSFIHAADIAAFLAWVSGSSLSGPVNACSPEPMSLFDLCAAIEQASDCRALIDESARCQNDPDLSPFSYPRDFAMSCELARAAGYEFASTASWLPAIAASAVEQACST